MKRWLTTFILIALLSTFLPVEPASSQASPIVGQLTAAQEAPDEPPIYLRGVTLQPGAREPQFSAALTQAAPAGESFRMVQFSGPIQPEWLDTLMASGLEIVAYLPDYAYLVWGEQPDQALERAAQRTSAIGWTGVYHPYYRLAPELRSQAERAPAQEEFVDVTVQFYNTHRLKESLERMTAQAEVVYQQPTTLNNLTHLSVRISAGGLAETALLPDVFNIETYIIPEQLDEIQGQIMAGNLQVDTNSVLPNGPGYLAWFDSQGLPKDPAAYPIVDVIDDGLDAGNAESILHPDFYVEGNKANADRVAYVANCTEDASGNGIGGHGNLNAGILGGYNNSSGFPYSDQAGYRFGLGISPYGRIASTKVFTNSGWFDYKRCGSSFVQMISQSYENGARITTNSWGAPASGAYTVDSQTFDFLTRDGSTTSGNQEMLHIFAAGNAGPDIKSVNSPATAKNVLTVGASENVRDHSISDGCYMAEGDNSGDIATFSSRGPAVDGRVKPDIVAPGTHIQGPASQDSGFNGSGVCGGVPTSSGYVPFYPEGQTLYTWSSGTSHSAPAVSGAVQVLYTHYETKLKPGTTPSPAMLKALILNTPRYLTGDSANDSLPSYSQGWGGADLGTALDNTTRILLDQTKAFRSSGESYELVGQVSEPDKPLRISLVWTDTPGTTTAGKALVNDLDLEVITNGQTYLGNVFDGAFSAQGGSADALNNVENVFLPAGLQGNFQVRVKARNLAGDGIPGNSRTIDQDFALVIYNGVEQQAPVLSPDQMSWEELSGNGNENIDPGEIIGLTIRLKNQGSAAASGFTATLQSTDPNLTILSASADYSDISPGSARENQRAYEVKISEEAACNLTIPLTLTIDLDTQVGDLSIPGLFIGDEVPRQFSANGLPKNIPDYNSAAAAPGVLQIPIPISDSFQASDIDVQVDIRHTWAADLKMELISPSGKVVKLSTGNGGMGDNYQETVFDDQADQSIKAGLPPFTGRYRPEDSINSLTSEAMKGQWIFRVQDTGAGDTGQVRQVSILATEPSCSAYLSSVEVKMAAGSDTRIARPGEEVSFSVMITNHSRDLDVIKLSADGSVPINLPASVGPLGHGESRPVTIRVQIPKEVAAYNQVGTAESKQIVFKAVSQNNPEHHAVVTLTVQIAKVYWYPFVSR